MLRQQTVEILNRMKLHAMAKAFEQQAMAVATHDLSFDDRFALLVDAERAGRENRRLARLLKRARLKQPASLEDIDFRAERGLDKRLVAALANCDWIEKSQNMLITGSTGVGKTWLACAFGNQAARQGHVVTYRRLTRLLEELETARADGSLPRVRSQLGRARLLIVDDWAVAPITPQGRQDILEIIDDRAGVGSVIITSQVPVSGWHEYLGEATIADAILDRIVHTSHRIALKGESLRKLRAASSSLKGS